MIILRPRLLRMPFARSGSFFVKKVSVMSTASTSANKLKHSLSVSTALSMGDYDSISATVSPIGHAYYLRSGVGRRFARSFLLSVEAFRGASTVG